MASTSESRSGGAANALGARVVWVALALFACTVLVYLRVRHHAFLAWDDGVYITANPNLRPPLGVGSIAQHFAASYEANWIPLTWLSLHIDRVLWGYDAAAFHLTNVALHATSSALLLAVLARTTGALWASAFVAAVFALHPLHVESVAWAAQRKDTLCGLFWMLALWSHVRWVEARSPGRWLSVQAFAFAALLSKPSALALPLTLLLFDAWPLRRFRGADARASLRIALREKLPLFAVTAAVGVAVVLAQRTAGSLEGLALPLAMRLMNATQSAAVYLGDAVWPTRLAYFYPYPIDAGLPLRAALCALLLAGITLGAWWQRKDRPWIAMGWAWYLGTLAPALGFVQVGMQARADRYTYLPLVGLAVIVAWGGRAIAARGPRQRATAIAAAWIALVAMSGLTLRQLETWRDDEALYQHALAVTRGNFNAHLSLAELRLSQGDLEAAQSHYEQAIRLRPRWHRPHIGLSRVASARGDSEAALAALERSLALEPRALALRTEVARTLDARGAFERARDTLEAGLPFASASERAGLLLVLGQLAARQGDVEAAAGHLRAALDIEPGWPPAQTALEALPPRAEAP